MQAIPGWSLFSVVDDRRDHTVFSVPAPYSEGEFHFAVQWDEDRDPRVLGAVLALYYNHPQLFESVLVWAEQKAWLTVDVVRKIVFKRKPPKPLISSTEIEVKRALGEIVCGDNTFPIQHDSWTLEVRRLPWPIPSDHAIGEIHRLRRLGLQRPTSVSQDIGVPAGPVTVTYLPEAKLSKTGGVIPEVPLKQFGTLEEALAERFPDGATAARIPVIGGFLVRRQNQPWEFHSD
jgi:hypothetical protein